MQMHRNGTILINLKITDLYNLLYNFELLTVNTKSEECVTLQSDFLEMSYELNIKIKFLASLVLGDF